MRTNQIKSNEDTTVDHTLGNKMVNVGRMINTVSGIFEIIKRLLSIPKTAKNVGYVRGDGGDLSDLEDGYREPAAVASHDADRYP